MSEQIIQGTIKYAASSKFAKNDRMNAVIDTPSGEVRAWASVGTPQGQALESLRKGHAAEVIIDEKGNFIRLANASTAQAPAYQPAPQTGTAHYAPAPQAQPMYQQAPTPPAAPQDLEKQVAERNQLISLIYNDLKNRFEGELPIDQEMEILTRMTNTVFISLTR